MFTVRGVLVLRAVVVFDATQDSLQELLEELRPAVL